jgi:hypothetical protein
MIKKKSKTMITFEHYSFFWYTIVPLVIALTELVMTHALYNQEGKMSKN